MLRHIQHEPHCTGACLKPGPLCTGAAHFKSLKKFSFSENESMNENIAITLLEISLFQFFCGIFRIRAVMSKYNAALMSVTGVFSITILVLFNNRIC